MRKDTDIEERIRQLNSIFNARSLAIVGATDRPFKFGTFLTNSQLRFGFKGSLYLVRKGGGALAGHKTYPNLESLPETPDLVYIAIPAPQVLDVLESCARIGVKGVVIISAGFSESGESGSLLEERALEIARRGRFRIIGPNCFGIYNPSNGLTLLPGHDFSKETGDNALISQSGGFACHVVRQGQSMGLRFSKVVSYGNALDVNESELIRYFSKDPSTKTIAGYIEGVRDGEAFATALMEVPESKNIVIWKVGRSEITRKAVISHTGSLAGSDEIWEGLFRQRRVIRVSNVDEICDTLLALKHIGRRCGKRIVFAGGGGGLCTQAADIAESYGLELPPLGKTTKESIRNILKNPILNIDNPLDIGTPIIETTMISQTVKAIAEKERPDVFVFDLALNFAFDIAGEKALVDTAGEIARLRNSLGLPIAIALYSRSFDASDLRFATLEGKIRTKLSEGRVAVFPTLERLFGAIARINS